MLKMIYIYIDFPKEVHEKGPKNIKIQKHVLLKDILQIDLKKFLWLKKLKILFHGHMLLLILMVKKVIGTFYEKELEKTN